MSASERARPHAKYEVVIGLEVHTHMRTESKLFSPAPVRYGDPPNHDVHPDSCVGTAIQYASSLFCGM